MGAEVVSSAFSAGIAVVASVSSSGLLVVAAVSLPSPNVSAEASAESLLLSPGEWESRMVGGVV